MGKLNQLFEYPVTKPIPYGKAFHILFGLLQLVILGVFVVWASATAGYDTITVASPNYNLTETLWYSIFIPDLVQKQLNKEGLCGGATSFVPGAAFSSTNDLFSYEIGSYYAEAGVNTRTTDVVQYRGNALDDCTPANILLAVDVLKNTVDAVVVVFCYGAWPIVATARYTFSTSPVKGLLVPGSRASIANTIWSNENSTSAYVFRGLDYLSTDLLNTAKLAQQQAPTTSPVEYTVNLHSKILCPISFIGSSVCPNTTAEWRPDFRPEQGSNTYANGSQTSFDKDAQNRDLAVPSRNLATALWSAVVWDLGSTVKTKNNIFTVLSSMNSAIQTTNTDATTSGVAGSTLPGAVALRADTAFPIPANGVAVVRATYLCRVKVIKSAAGFIVAVAGLAFSLFGSTIAIFTIGIVMLLRLHRPDLMHCEGHTPDCHLPPQPIMPYDQKQSNLYSPGLPPPPLSPMPPPPQLDANGQPILYNNQQGPASTYDPNQAAWPNNQGSYPQQGQGQGQGQYQQGYHP